MAERAKEILKNKNNERGLDLLDIKILRVIRTMCSWCRDKWINRTERNFRKRHK